MFNQISIKTRKFSSVYNRTHLWSMPLADQTYENLKKIVPCRVVEYARGNETDTLDTCQDSSKNEFSTQNSIRFQKWLYEHQHPIDCSSKRFAIIENFAMSGFGSTLHQVAWAFGKAIGQNRIAIYKTPGNWLYGDCHSGTPDCYFLPLTNCSIPNITNKDQVIKINANQGHWENPIRPNIFQNFTLNWYRTQLVFYIMRYRLETLNYVENQTKLHLNLSLSEINKYYRYASVYVRRSDKVRHNEMSRSFKLKEYLDLLEPDMRKANLKNIYLNSEDPSVFNEFNQFNQENKFSYILIKLPFTRNVVYRTLTQMKQEARREIILQFLTGLLIEVNADLHSGTLSSNWCRLVDEIRLVLGRIIPFYTPENNYFVRMK